MSSHSQEEYTRAQDNARIVGKQLYELQREQLDNTANINAKPSRLKQAVDKALSRMDEQQKQLEKARVDFDQAQKEFEKIQERSTIARDLYIKLEQEYRIESDQLQRDIESKRRKIESKISELHREQRSWDIKAKNAERDMLLDQRKQAANNNQKLSHGNEARRQNYL